MIKPLVLMVQFLTRLPVPVEIPMDKKIVSRGIMFFPLIGIFVGLVSWIVYYPLTYVNIDIASLGAVIGTIAVTGGLHLDGLSDTCDGFFSARSRERILEIMKDSRVGTFGVIAIVLDIFARFVVIKSLPLNRALTAFVLIYGASRLGAAMLISFGRSARPGGLGDMFSSSSSKTYFVISAFLFIIFGVFLDGWMFFVYFIVSILSAVMVMGHSYKVIGGLTGDVYGASIEFSEIMGFIAYMVVKTWI